MKKTLFLLFTLCSLIGQSQTWWKYANLDSANTLCDSIVILNVLENDSLYAPTNALNYYPYAPPLVVGSDMYYGGTYFCDTCSSRNGGSYTIIGDSLIKYIPPNNFVGWDQILYLLSNTTLGPNNHYDSTRVDIYVDTCIILGVSPLGITQTSLYPNPTKDIVNLIFDNQINDGIIRIRDVSGQVVFEKSNFAGDSILIDVSEYSLGLHSVEVIHNNNTIRLKFVKM